MWVTWKSVSIRVSVDECVWSVVQVCEYKCVDEYVECGPEY